MMTLNFSKLNSNILQVCDILPVIQLQVSMNTEISQQQIHCQFLGNDNVPIFDQDNWQNQQKQESSSQSLQQQKQNRNEHNQLINKINSQLQFSKQNFFKVNITKQNKFKPKSNKIILPALDTLKNAQSLSEKNPHTILKQGYLQKKTDGLFFKWHKRYIALTKQKIFCFEDHRRLKAIACINFRLLAVSIKGSSQEITLDFSGECENIIFKAKSSKQAEQWIQILQKVIDFNSKDKKVLLKTFIKPIYENKETMMERDFLQSAQTGDILLFYTKNTGAKIQRMFTSSDFDHVAMVVKMKKRDIMVFESNQLYGVSIYDWNQYLRYFDLYERVTVRKLNYARKSQLHHPLLNFMKKNLGKKYDINAMKFFKLESDFEWEKVKSQLEQDRGYFCSELIAKAFKSVGLIENKKSSGRYWPVDFSQKGEIQMKKGAWLGQQQSIVLNKHIKHMI